jgi:hypothetical protein
VRKRRFDVRGAFSLALLVMAFLIPILRIGLSHAAEAEERPVRAVREARIVSEHGDVYVKPDGQDKFFPALVETPLEAGDTIQTSVDGECDIALDGGTLLHLEGATEMNLGSLDEARSVFTITVGGLLGKIVGKNGQPANMEFHTPAAWGGIRGTEIAVETNEKTTRFGVFDEGKFAIHNGDDSEVLLTPHMELAAHPDVPLGDAGPMRSLLAHEKRMAQVRADREANAKAWKPAMTDRRKELRQKILAQKPLSADKMTRVFERAEKHMNSKLWPDRLRRDSAHERAEPKAVRAEPKAGRK